MPEHAVDLVFRNQQRGDGTREQLLNAMVSQLIRGVAGGKPLNS
jgi:hypothetical protein